MKPTQLNSDDLFYGPAIGLNSYSETKELSFSCEQLPSSPPRIVKHVRSFGKKLRNFSMGRSKPEETSPAAIYKSQTLALDEKRCFRENELEHCRREYEEKLNIYNESKNVLKRLKRDLGDTRKIDQHYKTAQKNYMKRRRDYTHAKNKYDRKREELETFTSDIPRIRKFNAYKKHAEDSLTDQFYLSKLLYFQNLERKKTAAERTLKTASSVATFANFALPGVGTAASVVVSVGNAMIEYQLDAKIYKKSKRIFNLCVQGQQDKSHVQAIYEIARDTSNKMLERFKDHLPLITPVSLKKLAEYNVKQMFSYAVKSHKKIAQRREIALSSQFVLGTLYARKKWRQPNRQKFLQLENSQETWFLMDLMRLTALDVQGQNPPLPSYCPLHYLLFMNRLEDQGYSFCRYSLKSAEEIELELNLWEDSLRKNPPVCAGGNVHRRHVIQVPGKTFIARLKDIIDENMLRGEYVASAVSSGLQLGAI